MIITYLDENEYKKKERALRKYFMRNYKNLIFEVYPTLKREGKIDGKYEVDLLLGELFEKVYGKPKLLFSVRNDVAILEDIYPGELFLDLNNVECPTYKGVPYRNKKDLEKIRIAERLI